MMVIDDYGGEISIVVAKSFNRNKLLRQAAREALGPKWWEKRYANRNDAYDAIDKVVDKYLEKKAENYGKATY